MAWELGFLSAGYNILRDLGQWLYGKFGPKDPVKVLQHRAKWKSEFERNISLLRNNDVIIRDIARMDSYPKIEEAPKGISPWFKIDFKDLYHRGFEVFLRRESIRYLESAEGWVYCSYKDKGAINALLVGRIPYDVVREVDWSGDEHYPAPHIYCDFTRRLRKEPYEDLLYCKRHKNETDEWFEAISSHEEVRRLSKKLRIKYE